MQEDIINSDLTAAQNLWYPSHTGALSGVVLFSIIFSVCSDPKIWVAKGQ
jgi:hypothetical protein